ncbi:hypothetical protein JS533_012120 [Bifidobacterium amazonense]|uniref:Uncharacterized protein n=1 Tax=Bifidobacterium amazonense TaxID=2809027 RepID=A0ABS9VYK8_9BIFI|nr:hypothetical protein [Bifidobacterium amazonense]MCH9277001.1 hypothetical protein [Bifidobacterium amazonense]
MTDSRMRPTVMPNALSADALVDADFSRAGVRVDRSPMLADVSDLLWYAALAMLPVDGTVAGLYMPFWTPISPWMFTAYALVNWRVLGRVVLRFRWWFAFPLLLVALSVGDWFAVGVHPLPAATSLMAVVGALACLAALEIAVNVKRLSWRRMVDVLIVAYCIAFLVGVVQWWSIKFGVTPVRDYFVHMMNRQYLTADSHWGGGRPQFLFAEPSYIGMHLYGVLLPVAWLIRERDRNRAVRLCALVVVFAVGSIIMGAGVRIILDSIVALVVAIVVLTDWRRRRQRLAAVGELTGTAAIGIVAVLLNNRLNSIAESGFGGDGSLYGRLFQSLGPFAGVWKHPLRLLFGYGAGNLADATHQGADTAVRVLKRMGLDAKGPSHWYAQVTPSNMFTMSAYTSFIVEFGLLAFIALVTAVVVYVTVCRAWSRATVCWLLLVAYLYLQFEGYAFYALPLLLWSVSLRKRQVSCREHVSESIGLSSHYGV